MLARAKVVKIEVSLDSDSNTITSFHKNWDNPQKNRLVRFFCGSLFADVFLCYTYPLYLRFTRFAAQQVLCFGIDHNKIQP